MNKKKILLTGSSGFVGSNFIKDYKDVYDISTFSFLKDDFKKLKLEGIETIIHLAALVHQMGGASSEAYHKSNVEQTIQLAQKAKDGGINHFIFMSSIKVYGEESETPYTEKSDCFPVDNYGRSKLEAEELLKDLEDESFRVSIIRTPIVYGPGVKANILSLIILVKKVSILPFKGIRNRRSMVYIGNLLYLLETIIQQKKSGVFLAGDDKLFSTTRLIELIALSLRKRVFLFKIPFFETFLKLVKPSFHKRLYQSLELDNRQTKEILGYKNKYSIEEGINLMINDGNKGKL